MLWWCCDGFGQHCFRGARPQAQTCGFKTRLVGIVNFERTINADAKHDVPRLHGNSPLTKCAAANCRPTGREQIRATRRDALDVRSGTVMRPYRQHRRRGHKHDGQNGGAIPRRHTRRRGTYTRIEHPPDALMKHSQDEDDGVRDRFTRPSIYSNAFRATLTRGVRSRECVCDVAGFARVGSHRAAV